MRKIIGILFFLFLSFEGFCQIKHVTSTYNGNSNVVIISRGTTTITYNDLADSLFARMDTLPANYQKFLTSQVFDSIDYYYRDSIFVMYFFAANTQANALLNWVSTSYNCTIENSPLFEKNIGFTGDGVNGKLNTNYNPSTAPLYNQDTVSIHIYVRNDTIDNGRALFGCSDGTNRIEFTELTTPAVRVRFNTTTATNTTYNISTLQGMWSIGRFGTSEKIGKNGVWKTTGTNATSGKPNAVIKLLDTEIGLGTNNQIAFFCISNIHNPAKLTEIVERYLDGINAGVIAGLESGTINFAEYIDYSQNVNFSL